MNNHQFLQFNFQIAKIKISPLTFFRTTNASFYVFIFRDHQRVVKGWESYAYTISEILEARKCFICFECLWQAKLPGTLPDVSLPLTVIGGYSDSNGIPTSMSDRSPPFHVHMCTVTPEVPPLLLLLLLLRVDSSSEKLDEKKKKRKEKYYSKVGKYYWSRIFYILVLRKRGGSFKFEKLMKFDRRWRGSIWMSKMCKSRSKIWYKICSLEIIVFEKFFKRR